MEEMHFVKRITFHLKRAQAAYQHYLNNDKQFLYAKLIKNANESVIDIAISHKAHIPAILEADVLALLEHLEIWTIYWEDLAKRSNPQLQDIFVFENKHNFPAEAVQRILNYNFE